jgi:hypothetical protein
VRKEVLHDIRGATLRRRHQRRRPVVRFRVETRAMIDEQTHLGEIAGGPHQGGHAVPASAVDVGASAEQRPHRFDRADSRRVHQRRGAGFIGLVRCRGAGKPDAQRRDVARADLVAERRRAAVQTRRPRQDDGASRSRTGTKPQKPAFRSKHVHTPV